MQQENSRLIAKGGGGASKDIEMLPYSSTGNDGSFAEDAPAEDHTKAIVLGGVDGVLASSAVVFGAIGAGYEWSVVVVLGVAIIFTGAFTLGADECLSSKAHNQFVQAEKRKGQWEFKHDRAGKIKEMMKIFEMKGVDHADAEIIINKMAKHENFFISLMVTEGLGLQLPEDDDSSLILEAFVMFCSFLVFGCVPLAVIYMGHGQMSGENLCMAAGTCIGTLLFLLGAAKGSFSSASWLFCAVESLLFGLSCAVISYTVGSSIASYIH